MRVLASVRNRPTWIVGSPVAWQGAAGPEIGAVSVPFGFDITEDGAGHFLLVCFAADGRYGADTWHPTLDGAYESAEKQFGVRRDEWGPGQDD